MNNKSVKKINRPLVSLILSSSVLILGIIIFALINILDSTSISDRNLITIKTIRAWTYFFITIIPIGFIGYTMYMMKKEKNIKGLIFLIISVAFALFNLFFSIIMIKHLSYENCRTEYYHNKDIFYWKDPCEVDE